MKAADHGESFIAARNAAWRSVSLPPLPSSPVLVAVAVVVVLAALYAQRSADRADVSEVLRLGS